MSEGVRDRIKRFTTCHREQVVCLPSMRLKRSVISRTALVLAGIKMQLQVCRAVGLQKLKFVRKLHQLH